MSFSPFFQPLEREAPAEAPQPRRARKPSGRFKADDPNTPDVNEAWVEPPKPKRQTKKAKE